MKTPLSLSMYFLKKIDGFLYCTDTRFMNSGASLSHLEGFFLRIRLGKWEEGLGGTGYHVACIRGEISYGLTID